MIQEKSGEIMWGLNRRSVPSDWWERTAYPPSSSPAKLPTTLLFGKVQENERRRKLQDSRFKILWDLTNLLLVNLHLIVEHSVLIQKVMTETLRTFKISAFSQRDFHTR